MGIHILVIQFCFNMGVALIVTSNDFSFQQESISRKIRNIILVTYFFSVSSYADMSIRHIFQYYCYVVRISFHFETLIYTQSINLVVEEISRNKSVVQTPITYFINQKEKHVSIRHNSILTLMKSGAPFFRIDIIYMIYLM